LGNTRPRCWRFGRYRDVESSEKRGAAALRGRRVARPGVERVVHGPRELGTDPRGTRAAGGATTLVKSVCGGLMGICA